MLHLLRSASILSLVAAAGLALEAPAAAAAATTEAPRGLTEPVEPPDLGEGSGEVEEATTEKAEEAELEIEAQPAQQRGQAAKPNLDTMVADFEKFEGALTMYRNPADGKMYLEISEDQIGQEFVYFALSLDGAPGSGHFRGAYRGEAVFSIQKYYNRIELRAENTNFYYDPDNAVSKAKRANLTPATAFAGPILVKSADEKRYLIDANKLFFSESLARITPPRFPGQPPNPFNLGRLDPSKSKVEAIDAVGSLDVIMEYVFTNPGNVIQPHPSVTDPRYNHVRFQHSIIPMPEEGFEPRIDDHRIGYFMHQVTDQTKLDDPTPYRDLINRWRLVKQDPDAELSDPVKPITFWMEDTTPVEYRDVIRRATLAWNQSFEKAGFSNAIEVKMQGEDGDCPARRIDCNVLRWTASPQRRFSGYGPSFYNPRTGEIMGADIMLELAWLTNRGFEHDLYSGDASGMMQSDPLIEKAVKLVGQPNGAERIAELFENEAGEHAREHIAAHDSKRCHVGDFMRRDLAYSLNALILQDAPATERDRLIEESIYMLILHEVGHTLGLNHNMKSSNVHTLAELGDRSVTNGVTTGSVMDYMPANITPGAETQGDFYNTRPGPYDDWAIEFGYRPDLDDAARAALLAKSVDPDLMFGNDADDMRAPGGWGIDPRTMIGDLSSESIDHSVRVIEHTDALEGTIKDKFVTEGDSWQRMAGALGSLLARRAQAGGVISRHIGGVHVERFVAGQEGSDSMAPYTPVPAETQKKAMQALSDHIFAPDAFAVDPEIVRFAQAERRGFNFFGPGNTEDPKLHNFALAAQGQVLAHVMSPLVLARATNARLYGNEYTAHDILSDLTDAVFAADIKKSVNTYRQNLQLNYVARLMVIVMTPNYDNVAKSAALANLRRIGQMVAAPIFGIGGGGDAETKAHRQHIRTLLRIAKIF